MDMAILLGNVELTTWCVAHCQLRPLRRWTADDVESLRDTTLAILECALLAGLDLGACRLSPFVPTCSACRGQPLSRWGPRRFERQLSLMDAAILCGRDQLAEVLSSHVEVSEDFRELLELDLPYPCELCGAASESVYTVRFCSWRRAREARGECAPRAAAAGVCSASRRRSLGQAVQQAVGIFQAMRQWANGANGISFDPSLVDEVLSFSVTPRLLALLFPGSLWPRFFACPNPLLDTYQARAGGATES